MSERTEKIKKIADSLAKSGLAINMKEAFRKAEEIIAIEEKIKTKIDVKVEKQSTDDFDVKEDKTINELMQEAGVDVDEIKEKKEEKTDTEENKEEISKEEITEEKVEKKEKKEVKEVKEKKEEPKEENTEKKAEKEHKKQKTNLYEEEEKIDISEIFNHSKKS